MRNSRFDARHLVGTGGGTGDGATRLTAGPNRWEQSDPRPEEIRRRPKRVDVTGVPYETASGCRIRVATLDIRSGQAGGPETALRALQRGNIDIEVLRETKTRPEAFTLDGYRVARYGQTEAGESIAKGGDNQSSGGEAEEWEGFEGARNFGPNAVSFMITFGTETPVRRQGLRAARRPTYDRLGKARVRVPAEGDGEATCRRPQRLTGKSEGPAGKNN